MYNSDWPPYIPVAKRRARARREVEKLRKKGQRIYPVEIEGRAISRSFWGKGWCRHLESFMDYENRLPRGRTYARNGSVCHLDIQPMRIEAMVSGSSMYTVHVEIDPLPEALWANIKKACAGQIGSILELLKGNLTGDVMKIVADRESGLFPKPDEINLMCSCPDWAVMCKHVAAVLYGVGNRLDTHPELLFLLRNVDAEELISIKMELPDNVAATDTLAADQVSAIFDIDMEDTSDDANAVLREDAVPLEISSQKRSRKKKKGAAKHAASTKQVKNAKRGRPARERQKAAATPASGKKKTRKKKPEPEITGQWVKVLRLDHGMSVAEFAQAFNLSKPSIYLWESKDGTLTLKRHTREKLLNAWRASINKE